MPDSGFAPVRAEDLEGALDWFGFAIALQRATTDEEIIAAMDAYQRRCIR